MEGTGEQLSKAPPKELSDNELRKRAQSAFKKIEHDVKRDEKEREKEGGRPRFFVNDFLPGDPHAPLDLARRIVNNEDVKRYLHKKRKTVEIERGIRVGVDEKYDNNGNLIIRRFLDSNKIGIMFTLNHRPMDEYLGGGSIEKHVDASKETKDALSKLTLKDALKPFRDALK